MSKVKSPVLFTVTEEREMLVPKASPSQYYSFYRPIAGSYFSSPTDLPTIIDIKAEEVKVGYSPIEMTEAPVILEHNFNKISGKYEHTIRKFKHDATQPDAKLNMAIPDAKIQYNIKRTKRQKKKKTVPNKIEFMVFVPNQEIMIDEDTMINKLGGYARNTVVDCVTIRNLPQYSCGKILLPNGQMWSFIKPDDTIRNRLCTITLIEKDESNEHKFGYNTIVVHRYNRMFVEILSFGDEFTFNGLTYKVTGFESSREVVNCVSIIIPGQERLEPSNYPVYNTQGSLVSLGALSSGIRAYKVVDDQIWLIQILRHDENTRHTKYIFIEKKSRDGVTSNMVSLRCSIGQRFIVTTDEIIAQLGHIPRSNEVFLYQHNNQHYEVKITIDGVSSIREVEVVGIR